MSTQGCQNRSCYLVPEIDRDNRPYRSLRFTQILVVVLCLSAGISIRDSGADDPESVHQALSSSLMPSKLKLHLRILASDELEGRATPSPGLNVAARYLASHLKYYGLQPLDIDKSYFQDIQLVRRKVAKASRLRVKSRNREEVFRLGEDFVGKGNDETAELIFVGHGLSLLQKEYDDYKGREVKDKIVLIQDGYPQGSRPEDFYVERQVGRQFQRVPQNRYRTAMEKGASGVIILRNQDFFESDDDKTSLYEQEKASLEDKRLKFEFRQNERPVQLSIFPKTSALIRKMLGIQMDSESDESGVRTIQEPPVVEVTFRHRILERQSARNVIGFLEGSDPDLKDEVVVLSAHYDHIGRRRSRKKNRSENTPVDDINNGADDDGSGTVGILQLAEAFSRISRPRRSILFLWTCGEELGLLGSEYFVKHPFIPLEKIVAVLNLDMIGRNYQDKEENHSHLFLIGTKETSPELGAIIESANQRVGPLQLDRNDPAHFFRRSDHYHFAKQGIPVAFFTTGTHKDYHRPSDEIEYIRFEKLARVLKLVFHAGLDIANRDKAPRFVRNKNKNTAGPS